MDDSRQDVLVAVDGSTGGQAALEWAARDAALSERGLTILSATHAPYSGWAQAASLFGPQLLAAEACTAQILRDAEARAREIAPWVRVTTRQALDSAAHAILKAAPGFAQVVLGAHGHTRMERVLAGSVSMHVVAHCSRRVVVVRPTAAPDGPVVVGLDGSDASVDALAYAVEHAALRRCRLVAVHAWEVHSPGGYGASGVTQGQFEQRTAEARNRIHAQLAPWRATYPRLQTDCLVERGHPFEVLRYHSRDARLLVLGSHGHSMLDRLVAGSTAMSALHQAECPIAVVRPHRGTTR